MFSIIYFAHVIYKYVYKGFSTMLDNKLFILYWGRAG